MQAAAWSAPASYKAVVKLTFAKEAALDGNVRRAIDLREGDVLDEAAFAALLRAAAALNAGKGKR